MIYSRFTIFLLLFYCIVFSGKAFQTEQSTSIQELEQKLAKARDIRVKRDFLWQLYEVALPENPDLSFGYLSELKKIALLENDKESLVSILAKQRQLLEEQNDRKAAIEAELERVNYLRDLKDTASFVNSELYIADQYKDLNQQEEALKHYFQALNGENHPALREHKDHIYNELGCLFRDQRDYHQASEYFMWAEREAKVTSDSVELARAINNLGTVYYHREIYPHAYNLFTKSLEIREALKDTIEIAHSINNVALIFKKVGKEEQALRQFYKAYELLYSLRKEEWYSPVLDNIGDVYLMMGKTDSALHYHQLAYQLSGKHQQVAFQIDAANSLIASYQKVGNLEKALEISREVIALKDRQFDQSYSRLSVEMQARYDSERKNAEISVLTQKQEINQLQLEQRTNFLIFGMVIALITLILLVLLYSQSKIQRETNLKLNEQNQKIEKQRDEISKAHGEIKSSMLYAQRIQHANLPKVDYFKDVFPQSFVFHRSLEEVSGDFFWFRQIGKRFVIAAADCTGHGVPGAFMSLISNYLLHEIVVRKQIFSPGQILAELHTGIVKSLDQENTLNRDGMDIALCTVNTAENKLVFSGAKNPLTYVSGQELFHLKGDRKSIGGIESDKSGIYPEVEIDYSPDTVFYIYSDGLPDQFGGPNNKKFGYKRLREKIVEYHRFDLAQQRVFWEAEFEKWRGEEEQIDDVLLVGFKPGGG